MKLSNRMNLRLTAADWAEFGRAWEKWNAAQCTHAVAGECVTHSKGRFARVLVRFALTEIQLDGVEQLELVEGVTT